MTTYSCSCATVNYCVFNSLILLDSLYSEVMSKTLVPATVMKSCDAIHCGMQVYSAHTTKSLWFHILKLGCLQPVLCILLQYLVPAIEVWLFSQTKRTLSVNTDSWRTTCNHLGWVIYMPTECFMVLCVCLSVQHWF